MGKKATKLVKVSASGDGTPGRAPDLVAALVNALPKKNAYEFELRNSPAGKAMFETSGELRAAIILALLPAIDQAYVVRTEEHGKIANSTLDDDHKYEAYFEAQYRLRKLFRMLVELLRAKPTLSAADADGLFGWLAGLSQEQFLEVPDEPLIKFAEQLDKEKVLTATAYKGLKRIRTHLNRIPTTPHMRQIEKIDKILAKPPAKPAKATAPSMTTSPRKEPVVKARTDTKAAAADAEKLLIAAVKSWPKEYNYQFKPERTPTGKAMLDAPPEVRIAAIFTLLDWLRESKQTKLKVDGLSDAQVPQYSRGMGRDLAGALLRAKLPILPADAERMFKMVAGSADVSNWRWPVAGLIGLAERLHESGELTDGAKEQLGKIQEKLGKGYTNAGSRKLVARLNVLLGEGQLNCIAAGEAWSDRALADHGAMKSKSKSAWAALLQHASAATSAKPSDKWEKQAKEAIDAVGADDFVARVLEWLPLVEKPRTQAWPHRYANTTQTDLLIGDGNADVLRGLAWMAGFVPANADVCRALGRLCETSLKKLPGMGPRLPKLANAAVWSLCRLGGEHALGQLARLKTRVTFRTTLQQIEKALDEAAARLGVTKADLEELGVPAYGFDENGIRREEFDGATVELKLEGRDVVTTWTNEKGKVVKSPPAGVKEKHAEELKELKLAAQDAEKMLTAQRDRIDALMGIPKTWKLEDFRPRYLEHPIVGQIARRLIWVVDGTPALFIDGQPTGVNGKPVKLSKDATVALWHPAERKIDDIVAWRRRLEELGITQPFKQAHREVYLLTDAERRTRTYSNRYAAHVIRQHQFHALAAQRGWRNKLRLMVDDTYPPASKDLPWCGLRAEFWIEGVGDDYGTDTLDSGAYLRLSTDQVRFYRTGAASNSAHAGGGGYSSDAAGRGTDNINEPIPLEDVPVLALSEIMRDVDLFVGVASVGNDPSWQDGGPEGRYRDYWQSYSFGDLTETAKTRKAVLERLVPRLKIASRASLSDKFLVVKGDLRTYKIHLGSGNILMEPNDQYLCIVPDRSRKATDAAADGGTLFLPFEGDQTLSLIISKAMLLADDKAITDDTITRQIKGK
jgi:hypothetical protein